MDRLGPFELDTVHCVDALEALPQLPDGCVDAVITDPPYCSGGVGEAQRTSAKAQGVRDKRNTRFAWFIGDNMGTAGLVWLLRSVAVECLRIEKGTGSMLLFCDWRMLPNIAPAIESAGHRYQNIVVWDKGHFGMGVGFRHQHEMILHFTAGQPEYFDRATANVLEVPRVPVSGRQHHTQKPTRLIELLIEVVSQENGIILDPFMGSGTTGVAAVQLGRRFLGFEINQEYCDLANKRIEAARRGLTAKELDAGQGTLFNG